MQPHIWSDCNSNIAVIIVVSRHAAFWMLQYFCTEVSLEIKICFTLEELQSVWSKQELQGSAAGICCRLHAHRGLLSWLLEPRSESSDTAAPFWIRCTAKLSLQMTPALSYRRHLWSSDLQRLRLLKDVTFMRRELELWCCSHRPIKMKTQRWCLGLKVNDTL